MTFDRHSSRETEILVQHKIKEYRYSKDEYKFSQAKKEVKKSTEARALRSNGV